MSFITSLAAVGTAVAGTAGVAGLSTGTAALLGAGTLAAGGAALGAGTSAAMGGDPGKGALMGAVTAPLMAPLGPALGIGGAGGEQAAIQGGEQAGIQALNQVPQQMIQTGGYDAAQNVGGAFSSLQPALEQSSTYVLPETGKFTPVGEQLIGGTAANVPDSVVANAAKKGIYDMADEQLLYAGANRAATDAAIKAGATDAIEAALPEVGWGQNAVANVFNVGPRTLGAKIGGSALEQGVYGAGIGGLSSAATGQDVGKGMGTGFLGGAIGGAVQGALAGQAGAGGTLGKIGTFAAEHPNITSAAIGMPVTMGLNYMNSGPSAADNLNAANASDREQYLRYLRAYRPSLSPGYAAGGITDLDGYMSNAQNIPNSNEVADPEGYPTGSVKMMAHGGIADLGGYSKGGNLLAGPGDGVSDDIPASIAGRQPARLAAGEYVIPSRIVSELGNGSTDAGAKRLDAMVQKINAGRAKTLGGKKYAADTRAYKHLPV